LTVVGTLHGLLYVPLVSSNVTADSATYIAAGRALDHGAYTTPLRAGLHYTPHGPVDSTALALPRRTWTVPEKQAFRPPGYPLLLALVGGGRAGASRLAALALNAAVFGVGAFLLALTVRRWWGAGIALAAEALYVVDPYSKHDVALVLSEPLAAALVLAAVYAFTRAWDERSLGWWGAAALFAAALTLTRVVFVIVLLLLAIAALLRAAAARRWLASTLVVCACGAALIGPWLAWTDHVVAKPVLATYGEGFNLDLAAHGEGLGKTESDVAAEPAFRRDLAASHRSAPSLPTLLHDPFAHPRYVERADSVLRARARSLYEHRLRHEPAQVAWEVLYRAYFLWQAHEDWYQPEGLALLPLRIVDWLLTALALLGALFAVRRGGAARAVVVLVGVYTLAIAVHHVEARFAMPFRGIALALVTLACAALARRFAWR
jgi:4-amino-4-deoxy-L-arabinose transferase-like glycosyltransferase